MPWNFSLPTTPTTVHANAPECELLSNGIAAGEQTIGRRLVDHDDRRGFGAVGVLEQPPAHEAKPDRAEIAGCNPAHRHLGEVARLGLASDDRKRVGEAGAQRMAAGDGHGLDAGKRRRAREQRRVEPVNRLDVGPIAEVERIAARRQLELGLQHAGRDRSRDRPAAGARSSCISSPAPTHEHDGERDLGDDQRRPRQRPSRPLVAPRASSVLRAD